MENKSKGLAIASMVLGIISVVCCCAWYIAIPVAIIGLVLGCISLKKISEGVADGKGMAMTGLVLSVVGIVAGIIWAIVGVSLIASTM